MGHWVFSPRFKFFIVKPDAKRGRVAYSLTTLVSCQALLATDGGVGQLDATFSDPGQTLRGLVDDPSLPAGGPTPHPMNTVYLWLQNRDGQWGKAWTGYIDEVHYVWDPDQGEMLHLLCTSPAKLWEIVHVSPSDAQTLAIASATNIAASSVLQFSAQRVGFPAGMLKIDPSADSGTGLQTSALQSAATSPDEQSWSAVIQALLPSTGLEWFFDGAGISHWRRIGYLGTAGKAPRPVRLDDILHADLAESDRGVVTTVEVRFGNIPLTQGAGLWTAPAAMIKGLKERRVVVYAPWLYSPEAAQYLANVLGMQYSSGLLQGSVTLPADPLYGVGTVTRVPTLHKGSSAQSDYYIASVAYSLVWGQQWTMTLGLRYGRSPEQSFPYVGTERGYPTSTTQTGVRRVPVGSLSGVSFDPQNPYTIVDAFAVVADATLTARQVKDDTTIIPVGSTIQVDSADGTRPLGKSHNGEYTVVAGQRGHTLSLLGTTARAARITFVTVGQSDQGGASTGAGTGAGTLGQAAGPDLTAPGTGGPTDNSTGTAVTQDITNPKTFALSALATALSLSSYPYVLGAGGPTSFDCSGLVWFSWAHTRQHTYQDAHKDFVHRGPDGLFDWFVNHGATLRPLIGDAEPGDLLFIQQPPSANTWFTLHQRGFSHIAFVHTKGVTYGANSAATGLRDFPIASYADFSGYPFSLALDLSQVTLNS